jgi:hypothetical protein
MQWNVLSWHYLNFLPVNYLKWVKLGLWQNILFMPLFQNLNNFLNPVSLGC